LTKAIRFDIVNFEPAGLADMEESIMAKTYLETLMGEREKILVIARQHWFILARNILLEIITLVAVIVLIVLALSLLPVNISPIVSIAGALVFLLALATMARDILNWTNREFIITNHRVMQVSGVFNKTLIDSSLDKVNDVKMVQTALGRLFGYGDIEILTASELGVNLFRQIENPIRFKTAMLNARQAQEDRYPRPNSIPMDPGIAGGAGNIPELIAELENLRQRGVLTEAEFQAKKAQLLAKL
jgi:hypothetical protein